MTKNKIFVIYIIDQISKILDLNEDINFKTFSNMRNEIERKLKTENTQTINEDQTDSVMNINERQIQQDEENNSKSV